MDGGMDIVRGDLVLAGGVIREVGKVEFRELGGLGNVTVVDAQVMSSSRALFSFCYLRVCSSQGAWLTPGYVATLSECNWM